MERTCQASSDYLGLVAVMKLIAAQTYLMLSSDSKEQVYGAQQKIWLNQQDRPMPIFVAARSRAFGLDPRGIGDGYSLYLDIEHIDGTSAYGYQVYFSGASVWQWQSAVIVPRKPVLVVYLFCLFRYRIGKAEFDDVTLRTLTPHEACNGAHHHLNHSDILVAYTEDTPIIQPSSIS